MCEKKKRVFSNNAKKDRGKKKFGWYQKEKQTKRKQKYQKHTSDLF